MYQIPPERMGIPEEVVFTVPVQDGSQLKLMLPESHAQIILEGAAAAGLQPGQYLAAVVTRAASNPRNPWNLLPPP